MTTVTDKFIYQFNNICIMYIVFNTNNGTTEK